jgi:hypothetical protein
MSLAGADRDQSKRSDICRPAGGSFLHGEWGEEVMAMPSEWTVGTRKCMVRRSDEPVTSFAAAKLRACRRTVSNFAD